MIYNNYASFFNQFHNATPGFKGDNKVPKLNIAWYNAKTPDALFGQICMLKKGGAVQRVISLAAFLLIKKPSDANLKKLAQYFVAQINKLPLKGADAVARKKIQNLYAQTQAPVKAKQPVKPAKKAHQHAQAKKQHKPVPKPKIKPQPQKAPAKIVVPPKLVKVAPAIRIAPKPPVTPVVAPRPTVIPAPIDNRGQSPWDVLNASSPRISHTTQPQTPTPAKPSATSAAFAQAFSNNEINPAHMRHVFKGLLAPVVPPIPRGINLTVDLHKIIKYISPSWPDDFGIVDDPPENCTPEALEIYKHSKAALLYLIGNRFHELKHSQLYRVSAENQALLQRMYGNIISVILNQIKTVSSLSAKEKANFDLKVRNFIQSLGITFHHCTDRLVTDSTRYYFQLVENQSHSVEDDETVAIEEKLHYELIQLRRTVFEEAYFSIDTDKHDAATHRFMLHYFKDELGINSPDFDESDNYSVFAIKDKIEEMMKAFYARYTPLRIAAYLNAIIKKTIEDQAAGKMQKNWYAPIAAFLTNKHPTLKLNTVFDLDTNSFTAAGLQLLLSDLGIIKEKSKM